MTKRRTTKRFISIIMAIIMAALLSVAAFAAPITLAEAKAIALAHAGFSESEVTRMEATYEIENGIAVFEVDFNKGIHEYDYTINAETGAILSYEHDGKVSVIVSGNDIGKDRAVEIALAHAGITSAEATIMKAQLDYDDGVAEYEIEFWANGYEYEYDINASTGAIISFSSEVEPGAGGSTNNNLMAKLVQLIERLIAFLESLFGVRI